MCRHLGWLGEPRSVASLVLDPAVRAAGAVVCAASAEARPDERRRLGRRVLRRRRCGAPALAQRGAAVGRRVVRLGGARAAQRLRGGSGALGQRRDADRGVGVGAVHRRTVAAVAQRPGRPRGAAAVARRPSRPTTARCWPR